MKIVLVIVIFLALAGMFNDGGDYMPSASKNDGAFKSIQAASLATNLCAARIRKSLSDPGSMVWNSVSLQGTKAYSMPDGTTRVLIDFRAKNSMGALVKNKGGCEVKDGVAELIAIEPA